MMDNKPPQASPKPKGKGGLLKKMFPSLGSGVSKLSSETDNSFDGTILEQDEDDDSSCPSYKSVAIDPASSAAAARLQDQAAILQSWQDQAATLPSCQDQAAAMFFDSEQKKLVEIDNFSFDQETNHFATSHVGPSRPESTDSSLALLDPGCLDAKPDPFDLFGVGPVSDHSKTTSGSEEPSKKRQMAEARRTNSRLVKKCDSSFESGPFEKPVRKPKICSPSNSNSKNSSFSSEADMSVNKSQTTTNARRKLSDESSALPSRPSTRSSTPVKGSKGGEGGGSKIPRFHKRQDRNCPKVKNYSPVQRKISCKRSEAPSEASTSIDSNHDHTQSPVSARLGRTKSHSASNLSKISVIDYHNMQPDQEQGQPRTRDDRSSSCGNITAAKSGQFGLRGFKSGLNLAKNNKYAHIESKVKQYIKDIKTENVHRALKDEEVDYGSKSFVLSPGRKCLSMSNLVHEGGVECSVGGNGAGNEPAVLTKSKMKAFLSSRHLDDLQISIKSRCKSRGSVKSASNLTRLLDRLTDDEDGGDDHDLVAYDDNVDPDSTDVCIFPVSEEQEDVVFEVEDLLSLAIEERRGKQEAKHVLSQLQENYDNLQRKYAQAEIIIDKYRFGNSTETLMIESTPVANITNCSSNSQLQTSGETNVSANQLLDDFSHFLKPGPYLTSEEVDNDGGIGSIRSRLEEIQDQVRWNVKST